MRRLVFLVSASQVWFSGKDSLCSNGIFENVGWAQGDSQDIAAKILGLTCLQDAPGILKGCFFASNGADNWQSFCQVIPKNDHGIPYQAYKIIPLLEINRPL